MRDRELNDCSFAIAWRSLELLNGLIREEEKRDFLEEVMLIARQEVERMLAAAERQEMRLHPTKQN